MGLKYNADNYDESSEGGTFTPVPGKYRVKIDTAEEGIAVKSGNDKLVLTMLCDYPGVGFEPKIFDHIALTDNMLWKIKHLCDATGLDFNANPEAHEFEGKILWVDCKVEEYNGYVNLKVKDYIGPPAGADGDKLPF